ncbi:MAG: hypothetical protein R3B91_08780 [Planctomycetaceae bacterium]
MNRHRTASAIPLLVAVVAVIPHLDAGEVRTQSGFVIRGRPSQVEGLSAAAARQSRGPVNIKHVWMVDDDLRRTFVPQRMVNKGDVSTDDLQTFDEFTLDRGAHHRGMAPAVIGSYLEVTPFDEYGRRTVTLAAQPKNIPIVQEITRLRPDIVTLSGVSHNWTHGLPTSALSDDVLLSLLKQATDANSPQDRLRVVRFVTDANRYTLAQQLLNQFKMDFPDAADRADEIQERLHHLIAVKALGEILERQRAGQHQLAAEYAQKFPGDQVSAQVLRESQAIVKHYEEVSQNIAKVKLMLGSLQAELDAEQFEQVSPLRSVVTDELSVNNIDRLEPFLRTEFDDTLTAAEKLGLAYTGWLLGNARAETNLALALRLWSVRFLAVEFLRSENEADRLDLLRRLHEIDGATIETVAEMIPRLPMPLQSIIPDAGVPFTVELPAQDGGPAIRYTVVLPLEYSVDLQYPLVVALGNRGASTEATAQWWAGTAEQPGTAMTRGYIVIAPEYADADTKEYAYGSSAHRVVLESIRDMRKRFNIDSDRVFLAGHGMGGDAAFDIGMSHPDYFAGVIPIIGVCDQHCKVYWDNAPELAWYVVGGEKDRDTLDVNAKVLNRMMIGGYDLTYTEYIERGYESYFEEKPRIFEWMELHTRVPQSKDFEIEILRPEDANVYWLKAEGFQENVLQPVAFRGERMVTRPQVVDARITPGGTVYVTSGAGRVTIMLSPSLVNLDERIEVRVSGKRPYRDFIKPDLGVLLEDLRERGDRQRLYWAMLEM